MQCSVIPVSALGCSRNGTDFDFAFREMNALVDFVPGAVNAAAEPIRATMIEMLIIFVEIVWLL